MYSKKLFWSLWLTKIKMNIKAEAKTSQLSYVWWVLEPALHIAIYYIVFGIFLNAKSDNFFAFLLCGKIPYLWFSRTTSNASNSIVAGRGLMNQISIPKWFFPAVVIGQDLPKTFFVFILMLGILITQGIYPNFTWLAIFPIAIMQLTVIAAFAMLFAALVPFLPDLKYIIGTFLIFIMFASGVFYDIEQIVLPEHQKLFLLNPMANIIHAYRTAIMYGKWPDWTNMAYTTVFWGLFLLLVLKFIKTVDSKYPRLALQ